MVQISMALLAAALASLTAATPVASTDSLSERASPAASFVTWTNRSCNDVTGSETGEFNSNAVKCASISPNNPSFSLFLTDIQKGCSLLVFNNAQCTGTAITAKVGQCLNTGGPFFGYSVRCS